MPIPVYGNEGQCVGYFVEQGAEGGAGRRNIGHTLGWPRIVTPPQLQDKYSRNGIAGAIVDARPETTWAGENSFTYGQRRRRRGDEEPPPESAELNDTAENLDLWTIIFQADLQAEITGFSGVVITGGDLAAPPTSIPEDQNGIAVWGQDRLKIKKHDPVSGVPELYELWTRGAGKGIPQDVHPRRVVHVSDKRYTTSLYYGRPRLLRSWNTLIGFEKVSGAGPESFWRGAFPGLHFDRDPKMVAATPEQKEEDKKQAEEYTDDARRDIRTFGTKVNQLAPQVVDFSNPVSTMLLIVSTENRIPLTHFTGEAHGNYTSTTNRSEFYERNDERRRQYAVKRIAAPIMARILSIETGVPDFQIIPLIGINFAPWPATMLDMMGLNGPESQAQGGTRQNREGGSNADPGTQPRRPRLAGAV